MQDQAVDTTAADAAVPSEPPAAGAGRRAWTSDPFTLATIAALSFLILALIGLASVIDLPQRQPELASGSGSSDQLGAIESDAGGTDPSASSNSGSAGSGSSGSSGLNGNAGQGFRGFGDGGSGRIDAGGGDGFDVRPIPGCPGGFAIGDNILVIPDPAACGYQLVPPGTRGLEPSGKIILVPSPDGDVGGLRFGPDGSFDLLAPGEVRADDLVIGRAPDGTFELQRPDGSRIEIAPGDGGLDVRDPLNGDEQFVPGPSEDSLRDLLEDEPNNTAESEPESQPESEPEPQRNNERDDPTDYSFLAPLLVILLVGSVLAFLAVGLKNGSFKRSPRSASFEDHVDDISGLQDTLVDYSAEITALDRLLWEIDQEPDPRTAIRRVYAALETGLDNPEMARRRSETPGIYLRRILGRFDELALPLRELTLLFEQARFSEHEITPEMRDRAVTILVGVRGHFAHAAAMAQVEAESAPVMA